jgi:hypothetical protein
VASGGQASPSPAKVPLSNRRGTCLLSKDPGVDRLSVSFPVRVFDTTPTSWSSVSTALPGRDNERVNYGTSEKVGGASAFIGVSVIRATGQAFGKIELNPSKVADPDRWQMAGVSEVGPAIGRAVEVASELLAPVVPMGEFRVRRLDVGRDFGGVARPAELIRGLAPIPRAWARRNLVHADPARSGAQTLMVGSGAGVARLYDKAAETAGRAPEGTLRFEAQCRSAWCESYGGVKFLGQLSSESVSQLAVNRWEWSAMGAEVAGLARVVGAVMGDPELSERERTMFLGYLVRQAAGDSLAVSSTRTLAKYRAAQRRLGLVADPGLLDSSSGVTSRLDWESGREVFRVAA